MPETIIDYVKTELRTFEEHPFHEVDSLVLSQFSYIHLGNLIAPLSGGAVKKPLTLTGRMTGAVHFEIERK